MKNAVLILGATSSIARATANFLAQKGYPLYLGSRDKLDLERIAADIKTRYQVDVKSDYFDAEDFESHPEFLNKAIKTMNGLSGVIVAFGDLGDPRKSIRDFKEAHHIIDRNYTGACSILIHCALYFEQRHSGFIVGISSVAGDRGRQSNYVYGSAKAGFSAFLEGLRNRLYPAGIQVLTVKPGYVDTAMIFDNKKKFLVASPEYAGRSIVKAIDKKRNIIYVPWFWRPIMFIVKMIPESIFKKLKT